MTDLHTTRSSPDSSNLTKIPGQLGFQGVPQITVNGLGNGGLPNFTFQGLSALGTSTFLPSNEISTTFQETDDLTRILGRHGMHSGMEFQYVQFTTFQPPRGRSEYGYNGPYVGISGVSSSYIGTEELLLIPTAATVPDGINHAGGSSMRRFSNIDRRCENGEEDCRTGNSHLEFPEQWQRKCRRPITPSLARFLCIPFVQANARSGNLEVSTAKN